MKLYADTPGRRTRQLLADVFVLLWVVTWVWAALQVHDTVALLTRAGELADSSRGFGPRGVDRRRGPAARIPVVGGDFASWLERAAGSGTNLRAAGTSMASTVETVAVWLALVTALVPIVIVAGVWLWFRVRFVRGATTAQRFIDSNDDLDLFALRALANQPLTALAKISDDPAGAWRRGGRGRSGPRHA